MSNEHKPLTPEEKTFALQVAASVARRGDPRSLVLQAVSSYLEAVDEINRRNGTQLPSSCEPG